jgi:hypothetical protein
MSSQRPRLSRNRVLLLGLLVAVLGVTLPPPRPAWAHDVPNEFVMEAFIKPERDRLHLLLRAPLEMLLDMRLPKRGPGYIDLAERERLDEALGASAITLADEVGLFEGGERLTLDQHRSRLSVPADRAFASYERAVAHISGPPLPTTTNLFWNQGWFDLHLEYAIEAADSKFALQMGTEPDIARRLHVLVTYLAPDGRQRAYDLLGDAGRVPLDPGRLEAAWLFAEAGWWRMVNGWQQLVFLLVVALPFHRRTRQIGPAAAALAAAFAVSALPVVSEVITRDRWLAALVDAVVAASVLTLAIGNLVSASLRWRWLVVGALGLAHGAALSSGVDGVLQFGGEAMALSRVAFVLGVEAGLAAAMLGLLVVLRGLFRHPAVARHGVLVAGLLIGHQAWHWTVDQLGELSVLPPPDVDLLAVVRGATLLMLVLAGFWLLYEITIPQRRLPAPAHPAPTAGEDRVLATSSGRAGAANRGDDRRVPGWVRSGAARGAEHG